MAEPYFERLTTILHESRLVKPRSVRLECKHFFSGAALYANGTIFASLTPVGFAVKLSEESRAALVRQRRGRPLRYFKGGPVKKNYAVLAGTTAADSAAIRVLLRESVLYVTCGKKKASNPQERKGSAVQLARRGAVRPPL